MRRLPASVGLATATLLATGAALAWVPKSVSDDPLLRLPGTQPKDGVILNGAGTCTTCHNPADADDDIGSHWRGSMMGQAMRDPLFWAALTVTLQDSIWAIGNPNAGDLCLRCHSPRAWLGGRSDPANAALVVQDDFDGVTCDLCHRAIDPFHEATAAGTREGSDWVGYWDEAGAASADGAAATLDLDHVYTEDAELWSSIPQYDAAHSPTQAGWTENGAGEYFVTSGGEKRAGFADALSAHLVTYSRYHKSKYFCETCHDVSNPVFVNQGIPSNTKGDLTTVLPSEAEPPYAFTAVERTWSEFALSDYGLPGGAPGSGAFDPSVFVTSRPGNAIATCQDCHMPDKNGRGCDKEGAVIRPGGSAEHPKSGHPTHDLTGGNAWIPWILASTVPGSPNYDAVNEMLLTQGSGVLTMQLDAGDGVVGHEKELLAGAERAKDTLHRAATIQNLAYDGASGALSFRVRNHTGHKLITGYPDGRRMFLSVRVFQGNALLASINPYDAAAGTLKGQPLAESPSSPPLGPGETFLSSLVYETRPKSSLTGEAHTFHFVLADGHTKDNRIPPRGFRIAEAAARRAEPFDAGAAAPGLYSAAEYAGGFDDVALVVPPGGTSVLVRLSYQTTSREYVEFLRDEIDGTGATLTSPTPSGEAQAYVAQSDPYFGALKAWGQVIWDLWQHNQDVPGAAPIVMAQAMIGAPPTGCAGAPDGTPCDDHDLCTEGETCTGGVCGGGTTKTCSASDVCHGAGACDPATGLCSNPVVPDGGACTDKSQCTNESCQAGVCVATTVVSCPPSMDECLEDGTCNPLTAACENLPVPDGTPCSTGTCQNGFCTNAGGGGNGGSAGSGGAAGAGGDAGGAGGGAGGAGGDPFGGNGGGAGSGGGCSCSVPASRGGALPAGLALALLASRRRSRRR